MFFSEGWRDNLATEAFDIMVVSHWLDVDLSGSFNSYFFEPVEVPAMLLALCCILLKTASTAAGLKVWTRLSLSEQQRTDL